LLPPLEAITKIVERISKIILGLRRFSRDSSQDNKKVTLISQIVDDTLTLCNEKMKANSIDLKLNHKNKEYYSACIPEQISQVILNLLSNSVDAIIDQPKDARWIQIDVTNAGPDVEIAVTDSGNGIPDTLQAKLMQPFFTTKEIGKGTGLGLSISRGIIADHGGIFFYDPSSKNTRFVIQLPHAENGVEAA
jgi:C4-dicarboxylate-specific signal transduction histidine kinase